MSINLDDLLTVHQIAQVTGYDRRKIDRATREGHLRCAHQLEGATGARLFVREDVIRWLEETSRDAHRRLRRINQALDAIAGRADHAGE